ncbi:MAG: NUDIX hydrolase [Actinobacteria bacterium]|nr:NUDIX hydrolase [Actinomycetota bacterium]
MTEPDEGRTVLAAGGVVRRRRVDRGHRKHEEIAVVHRPRYDDWSLPKGKLEPGEPAETGALREVEEETGLRCRLGPELSSTRYRDRHGRPKQVRYWMMDPIEDTDFVPNDEVDELRWCSPHDAVKLLTYEHDRRLVEDLRE